MATFINELYRKMKETLEQISSSSGNTLQRAEQSFRVVQDALSQLKEYIVSYTFKDDDEEIQFFKEIKPMFLRELIFFEELYHIELNQPISSAEELKGYFSKVLAGLATFFERNKTLYAYYRTGKTIYDDVFFRRDTDNDNLSVLPEYSLDADPRFSTPGSSCLAKLQAYEQLREHIQLSLNRLSDPEIKLSPSQRERYLWTDSKTALIELAYAMYARGSVNNGKGDIKTIIAALESLFNVEVGNFYRAFQNMRIRKKNRTTYLDALKESLEKRMDETDMDYY